MSVDEARLSHHDLKAAEGPTSLCLMSSDAQKFMARFNGAYLKLIVPYFFLIAPVCAMWRDPPTLASQHLRIQTYALSTVAAYSVCITGMLWLRGRAVMRTGKADKFMKDYRSAHKGHSGLLAGIVAHSPCIPLMINFAISLIGLIAFPRTPCCLQVSGNYKLEISPFNTTDVVSLLILGLLYGLVLRRSRAVIRGLGEGPGPLLWANYDQAVASAMRERV